MRKRLGVGSKSGREALYTFAQERFFGQVIHELISRRGEANPESPVDATLDVVRKTGKIVEQNFGCPLLFTRKPVLEYSVMPRLCDDEIAAVLADCDPIGVI